MKGEKDLLFSKTTLGAVVLLISMSMKPLGIDIGDQQEWVEAISAFVGAALVLIGRVTATKRITSVAGISTNKADGGVPKCVAAVLLLLLAGCVSSGIKPETMAQRLATAQATLEGVTNSTAVLLNSQIITVDDAIMMRSRIDDADLLLKMSRQALNDGQPQTSLEKLNQLNQILIDLTQIIEERSRNDERGSHNSNQNGNGINFSDTGGLNGIATRQRYDLARPG